MSKATPKDWRNFVLIWLIGIPLVIFIIIMELKSR